MDCAGGDLLFLLITIPVYLLLIVLLELRLFSCFSRCCEPRYLFF